MKYAFLYTPNYTQKMCSNFKYLSKIQNNVLDV